VVGSSVLVEFTLTPEGDERTRLRVVESGHESLAWPDEEKERYADEHQDGWGTFLDRLAALFGKRQPE
jgi:uncharacterized protein YndB with AHSA1/START domain